MMKHVSSINWRYHHLVSLSNGMAGKAGMTGVAGMMGTTGMLVSFSKTTSMASSKVTSTNVASSASFSTNTTSSALFSTNTTSSALFSTNTTSSALFSTNTTSSTSSTSKYSSSHENAVKGLKGRNLLRIDDYSHDELLGILAFANDLKRIYKREGEGEDIKRNGGDTKRNLSPLLKKSVAMIFQKRSTRTRVSTETGMSLLGGHSLFLSSEDIQLGKGESIRDTATVLSRFNSLILARVFGHEVVSELAKYSTVPVINALSSMHHPLQILADFMTLQEHFGDKLCSPSTEGSSLSNGTSNISSSEASSNIPTIKKNSSNIPLTLGWVGDGNNVSHDIILGAPILGMNVKLSSPLGYEPQKEIIEKGLKHAEEYSLKYPNKLKPIIKLVNNPEEAANDSDVIFTDTWVSMGQERDALKRKNAFQGYQVTMELANKSKARENWRFMHCLPRHQEEVSDDVFYSNERSLVWDEAENRMWTVMAVMCAMSGVSRVYE
jgi:ornithine carbamoyltransferase